MGNEMRRHQSHPTGFAFAKNKRLKEILRS